MSSMWIGKSKKEYKIETKIKRKKKRLNMQTVNLEKLMGELIHLLKKLCRLHINI